MSTEFTDCEHCKDFDQHCNLTKEHDHCGCSNCGISALSSRIAQLEEALRELLDGVSWHLFDLTDAEIQLRDDASAALRGEEK
jgi:hypothetical protein